MDFGVIIPNEVMRERVEALRHLINVSFEVVVSDIAQGPLAAQSLLEKGAKILVTRRGIGNAIMASGIKANLVEIPISGYDVVRLLSVIKERQTEVALISANSEMTKGIQEMAPIFGIQVYLFPLHSTRHIKDALAEVKRRGLQIVIGGEDVAEHAKSMDIEVLQLYSSNDTLLKSLQEAERVMWALKAEQEITTRSELMLSAIPEAVISMDSNGKALQYNQTAIYMFEGDSDAGAMFLKTSGIAEAVRSGINLNAEVCYYKNLQYVCSSKPVYVDNKNHGAVVTIHEIGKLQRLEEKARTKLYNLGHITKYSLNDIVFSSSAMGHLVKLARKYAATSSTVLILGESGTGKELFAQGIHAESPRSKGPFVAINFTSLPESLIESELFGYTSGAFTGARKGGSPGLFEMAHKGTLFLDEIGEIPTSVQARLLRVLEEKTIRRIGHSANTPIDVRVICATNKNLFSLVEQGLFREDLYYRLNILRLDLPPLRERREDISPLLGHLFKRISCSANKNNLSLCQSAEQALTSYSYPGNIRELRNIIERLIVMAEKDRIDLPDVNTVLMEDGQKHNLSETPSGKGSSLIRQEEMALILKVIQECGNNKTAAARKLGMSPATLWRRLRRLKENN